jgi:hypothetical protein
VRNLRNDSTLLSVGTAASDQATLQNRLEVHDRKQFEIKLEYQPAGPKTKSRYLIETFIFLPSSLNVNAETYPREAFYADIHNYVRLKTPVLAFREILQSPHSPLLQFEQILQQPGPFNESQAVYHAKLLSCVFRGALRRMGKQLDDRCDMLEREQNPTAGGSFQEVVSPNVRDSRETLARFRAFALHLTNTQTLQEKTKASLRLVDEYMSLSIEQFFRKAISDMERMPRAGIFIDVRRELMAQVITEEAYRKENKLRSVLSPTGENEEYMWRISVLKKFCTNILFLSARRDNYRAGFEEVLFAVAAGFAMAFSIAVPFVAGNQLPQNSLNFFILLVVGYMFKDRIKEGLRKTFKNIAARHLFDRSTKILDPVTLRDIGVCREKVDYGKKIAIPPEVSALRRTDDLVTVSEGELNESWIRYQKEIVLHSEQLPRVTGNPAGVTDIIRLNVERLLRDMDDPEYALEYVDVEDFSVARVKAAKRYQVDLGFRFIVHQGDEKRVSVQMVRLMLDRNGIKRMIRLNSPTPTGTVSERSVA